MIQIIAFCAALPIQNRRKVTSQKQPGQGPIDAGGAMLGCGCLLTLLTILLGIVFVATLVL